MDRWWSRLLSCGVQNRSLTVAARFRLTSRRCSESRPRRLCCCLAHEKHWTQWARTSNAASTPGNTFIRGITILQLLAWWRPAGGWPWTEGGILILAAIGAVAAFRSKADLLRFLAVYTILVTAIYSLIPYKTPWCLLAFLQPMILLAGTGLVSLLQLTSGMTRISVAVAVAGVTVHLFVQAFLASRWQSADPGNPYTYAHTTRDVFTVRQQLERVAVAHEEGRNLPVQVISTQNLWPLPWYLRDFPHVQWRRSVTNDMPGAPVILATPDMEPALLHHLYEVLPPGQRPLYVSLFDDVELRPGVPLRGYVQQSLAQ